MKKSPPLLWYKQATALFFALLFLLSLPMGTVSAAQMYAENPISAQDPSTQDLTDTDAMDTPSDMVSEDDNPASVFNAPSSGTETLPENSEAASASDGEGEPAPMTAWSLMLTPGSS